MSNRSSTGSIVGLIALIVLGAIVIYAVQTLPKGAQATPTPASGGAANLRDAVMRNDAAAVRAALASGADPNLPLPGDDSGRGALTPLMTAASEGKPEAIRILLDAKAKVDARTEDGRSALMFAAMREDTACLRAILDAGARTDARNSDGWTALMFASARGDVIGVRALVQAGADVNASNKWRQTALMVASLNGSIEKVRALLEAGANAAAADADGNTSLLIAAGAGDEVTPELLTVLVKAGAPVDATDTDGVTALMKAAERGDADRVRALLASGANRTLKDKPNGWTARDWAAKRDDEKGRAVVALLDAR